MHSTTSVESASISAAWEVFAIFSSVLPETLLGRGLEILSICGFEILIMLLVVIVFRGLVVPQQVSKVAGKRQKGVGSKVAVGPEGDEAKRVKKFVASLMTKSSKNNPGSLLKQYHELAQSCGATLRQHIPDDQHASSMYLALISSVVAAEGADKWSCTSRLLDDMQAFGFPRNADFYGGALKIFGNAHLFQEGIWLSDVMAEDGVVPGDGMLILLLSMAVTCGETAKALSFFEQICAVSQPKVRTIMTVLRVHVATNDWQGAVKLLDRMASLGTPPDNLILNGVLGLCVSCSEFDAAQLLLTRWKDITDVVSWNILLKGCAQVPDLYSAEMMLHQMGARGPSPNLISYNTVMDCAVRSMRLAGAGVPSHGQRRGAAGSQDANASLARRTWELVDELIAQGLQPDRYTCSTLVKGMHLTGCCASDIDRAVDLLNRVGATALGQSAQSGSTQDNNERLLEVLFNTLLDACVSVQDLDRVAVVFALMQQFGVQGSVVTYGTLIKAFGQAGRLSRCHDAWEDMCQSKIQPTIVTFGCYINACIKNEDIVRAEEIFESMRTMAHGVRPNAVIYTSLIRGFAQARQPYKALGLYRRMRLERVAATSVTFNSVIDIVGRQLSDLSVLQEIIGDMCKAGIKPDAVTYSILIKATCSGGDVRSALSLFRQFQGQGLVFDDVAFNTLLLSCSKAEQVADAEYVFEEMRRCGLTPTHTTFSIMVKMYGKAKMLDKAMGISEICEKEYGQKPNLQVYTCLIQACTQNKQVRTSWEIFNRMVSSGVEADAIAYGTMIHGCIYVSQFADAMSLVRHAYKKPSQAGTEGQVLPAMPALKQVVPLQQEVLQLLLDSLRRKEQTVLAAELNGIMSSQPAAPSDKTHSGKSNRRAR